MGQEKERKWLLSGLPQGLTQIYQADVIQGYISFCPEVRVRKEMNRLNFRDNHAEPDIYFQTVKHGHGVLRDHYEIELSEAQFEEIKGSVHYPVFKKYYRYYLDKHHKLEVNQVSQVKYPFIYSEVEFGHTEEPMDFNPYAFKNVITREVTGVKEFEMSYIALNESMCKKLW